LNGPFLLRPLAQAHLLLHPILLVTAYYDSDPNTPNFVPPPTSGSLNGALTAKDTSWACETSKGFVTETQSFYSALSDGSWIMLQVIFSVTGYVHPVSI
jgi:hypothetical protein